METYQFTLRFDDDNHSLTQYNGLTVQQVGELLIDLTQALGLNKDQKLILSDIKGNCYALELSTENVLILDNLKVIHKKISDNDYRGLNDKQKNYASRLKAIIGSHLNLRAYDKDKGYYIKVKEIILPKEPQYYFEISTVYGIITAIGGASLDGKANIKINQEIYNIEVNPKQEKELLRYYKEHRLSFQVRKKIDFANDKIISAELIDFDVLEGKTFIELVNESKILFPDGLLLEPNE